MCSVWIRWISGEPPGPWGILGRSPGGSERYLRLAVGFLGCACGFPVGFRLESVGVIGWFLFGPGGSWGLYGDSWGVLGGPWGPWGCLGIPGASLGGPEAYLGSLFLQLTALFCILLDLPMFSDFPAATIDIGKPRSRGARAP